MRTVSNVVRGTGRFSEATRERVLRAVEELGWATAHLLARGRRRIAVAGRQTAPHAATSATRLTGHRQALAAAGLAYDETLAPPVAAYHRADGAAAARVLLDLPEPPDAVFCFADTLAEGVLHAARERGLPVPGDLGVVGFDDTEAARYTAPPLTTVAPDKREPARLAVTALLEGVDGARAARPRVLPAGHRLVVRESG